MAESSFRGMEFVESSELRPLRRQDGEKGETLVSKLGLARKAML